MFNFIKLIPFIFFLVRKKNEQMKTKYKIIAKGMNIAVAIPIESKSEGLNDFAIIVKLDTLIFYDGVQVNITRCLNEGVNDDELLKSVRCWGYHKLDANQIENYG